MYPNFKFRSQAQFDPDEVLETAQQANLRIHVERAFGRLKGRFRCLKILSRFQDVTHVDMEFRACVVLHKTCHFSDGQWHLCLNHALMQFHGFTHVDLVPLAPFPGHMTLHVMP